MYPLEINVETHIDHIKEQQWPQDNDFEGFDDELPSYREQKLIKLKEKVAELASE